MKEVVQRHLVKPMIPDKMPKGPSHRRCLRVAGMAIANVLADKNVPLKTVLRDLEDLRETIDFAIVLVSQGLEKPATH